MLPSLSLQSPVIVEYPAGAEDAQGAPRRSQQVVALHPRPVSLPMVT